jgi:hypothetical protein
MRERSRDRSYGCPDISAILFEVKRPTGSPQPLRLSAFADVYMTLSLVYTSL